MPDAPKKPLANKDTTVSLHPLSFGEAIRALVNAPKRRGSEAGGSGSTREAAPSSETSGERSGRRRISSGD